jgi:beta-lactamase class A
MLLVVASLLFTQVAGDSLAERIKARVAQEAGAEVGVAYTDLSGNDTLFLNADTSFHAASTMKVPVMIDLFKEASTGAFSMGQRLLVVNQFSSIVDGSQYSLDVTSDSDSSLYARIGTRVPVDTLLRLMITRSSNLATNTLIELVGGAAVTRRMRALGAARIEIRRGVEDGKAFERGLNNTTTARDLATILGALEEGRAGTPEATRQMRDILLGQEFNEKIPAGVPPNVRVAHKTGEITAHSHDAAIVYPPRTKPYVLVVLTRGITDGAQASNLIAAISRLVYEHHSVLHNSPTQQ